MFSELEDYKDSEEKAVEIGTEVYLIEFCTANYYNWINQAKEATKFFTEKAKNGLFKWLTNDEIINIIVGSWEIIPSNEMYYSVFDKVKYYPNGTYINVTFQDDRVALILSISS